MILLFIYIILYVYLIQDFKNSMFLVIIIVTICFTNYAYFKTKFY